MTTRTKTPKATAKTSRKAAATGKAGKTRAPKATEPVEKKASALDAAARVLSEKGVAMTCQELIGAMAAKGYWTSPGGKTPHATLYSAMLRELATKGDASRFRKAAPGRFAAADAPGATTDATGESSPIPAKKGRAKTPTPARDPEGQTEPAGD